VGLRRLRKLGKLAELSNQELLEKFKTCEDEYYVFKTAGDKTMMQKMVWKIIAVKKEMAKRGLDDPALGKTKYYLHIFASSSTAFEREAWSVAAELSPDVKLAREEFSAKIHGYDKHVERVAGMSEMVDFQRTIDETKSSSYDRIMASVLEGWVF